MSTFIFYMEDPISGVHVSISEMEEWRMKFALIYESGMELILIRESEDKFHISLQTVILN